MVKISSELSSELFQPAELVYLLGKCTFGTSPELKMESNRLN